MSYVRIEPSRRMLKMISSSLIYVTSGRYLRFYPFEY